MPPSSSTQLRPDPRRTSTQCQELVLASTNVTRKPNPATASNTRHMIGRIIKAALSEMTKPARLTIATNTA